MKRLSLLPGRMLLACISWPMLSRLWGRLTRLRRPRFLARWMIRAFQKRHRIAMDEFQGTSGDYRTLGEFFLRPLDSRQRPLPQDGRCLLSPADGTLSELELVSEDRATQVKGWSYPLSLLLAEDVDFACGWHVATIYLSPRDYHRFHYPLSARISGCFHGGTRLFPVNGFSVKRVRRLYLRNERVVTRFVLGDGCFYLAAVGATFVGNIGMKYLASEWPKPNIWKSLDIPVEQMAEMGHFAMGSTIILLVPAERVQAVLAERGMPLRVGQPLFKIKT
ncbi:MAG: phosphatidylserine decarboxylase [Candidatus Aminicenantes bacterium]|nr:phosphatidylserine decarboxylase [Candidatus Aminicenantes bacterium]